MVAAGSMVAVVAVVVVAESDAVGGSCPPIEEPDPCPQLPVLRPQRCTAAAGTASADLLAATTHKLYTALSLLKYIRKSAIRTSRQRTQWTLEG